MVKAKHVSRHSAVSQEVQMKFMDGRIRLMNEILSGMKILKFYAWEKAFLQRVGVLRDGELQALEKSQILYSVSLASFNSSSFLASLYPGSFQITFSNRLINLIIFDVINLYLYYSSSLIRSPY